MGSPELEALLADAVATGVTPGFACVVATGDAAGPRFVHAGGHTHRDHGAPAVDLETVFDLASLTKVLATTLLCAEAVHDGKIDLEETPWPAWPGVRVRNLLAHDSGLPAWSAFYAQVPRLHVGLEAGARDVLRQALATAPLRPPEQATLYSDLGFIALGALLEERLGARLDRLFGPAAAKVYKAPGMRFVPLYEDGYHPALPRVAATTRCAWRGRVVQGQVDDENAFAMGGVAGHAGLFSTALDVECAARAHLAALLNKSTLSYASTLRRFLTWPGERALGWDRASTGGSTGGALSTEAVGHLGFTGTSLWLDARGPGIDGALYILLTNRVCESRENDGIRTLRQQFHRAARHWLAQVTEEA